MGASTKSCFYLLALSAISACVSGMPALGQDERRDADQLGGELRPSRSWSGTLRGPRRTSLPSRFNTQLVDLNRNPTYYNYHALPEQELTDLGSPVWGSRQRRSPLDFGGGLRDVDAGFSAGGDAFRPPRFRDDQPRQPERTRFSDYPRTGCVDGGPSCTPRPQRKYFDFYS